MPPASARRRRRLRTRSAGSTGCTRRRRASGRRTPVGPRCGWSPTRGRGIGRRAEGEPVLRVAQHPGQRSSSSGLTSARATGRCSVRSRSTSGELDDRRAAAAPRTSTAPSSRPHRAASTSNIARTAARSALPDAVRGSASTTVTATGTSYRARCLPASASSGLLVDLVSGPPFDRRHRHRTETGVGDARPPRPPPPPHPARARRAPPRAAPCSRRGGWSGRRGPRSRGSRRRRRGARSVVRTHSSVPELRGADLEQPDRIGAEVGAAVGIDDAQRAAGVRASDAAPLRHRVLLVVGQVPSRDATTELGGAVGREHGDAVARGEGVGEIGVERRGARHHRAHARRRRRGRRRRRAPSAARSARGSPSSGGARAPRRTQPSTLKRSSSAMRRPSSTACTTRKTPLTCTSGAFTMTTPVRSRSSDRRSPSRSAWHRASPARASRSAGRCASAARWCRW